jgi:hypothetical protein
VAQGRLEGEDGAWWVPAGQRFVADDTIAWLATRARPLDPVECAA